MRWFLSFALLACSLAALAQNSPPPASSTSQTQPKQPQAQQKSQASSKPSSDSDPNLAPPRSDSVNINALGDESGESSSKDTQIDLTPPPDDARTHRKDNASDSLRDEGSGSDNGDVSEMRPWDPHRAAKDIEVGDFYFKRKNYRAAEDRYREALYYKDNDALATYHLAVCLDKMNRPDEAIEQYEKYLKILPHGPQEEEVKKAIERLKSPAASVKPAK